MLPKYDELHKRLLRSAFMGWCSSFVSDICSNSIRVIKTSKQTSTVPITYREVVKVRMNRGAGENSLTPVVFHCPDIIASLLFWLSKLSVHPFCAPSQNIVAKEGVQGLFFRGLGTKLITNGIQGILFSVLWRLGQDYLAKKEEDEKTAADAVTAAAAATKKK